MERILEEYRWIDGIERSFGLPSHPSTGSTRGVEREASKNWAGSWSRKNARADDAP